MEVKNLPPVSQGPWFNEQGEFITTPMVPINTTSFSRIAGEMRSLRTLNEILPKTKNLKMNMQELLDEGLIEIDEYSGGRDWQELSEQEQLEYITDIVPNLYWNTEVDYMIYIYKDFTVTEIQGVYEVYKTSEVVPYLEKQLEYITERNKYLR